MTHAKLIDDVTIGESVDMEEVLRPQEEEFWERPLIRRSRNELAVPDCLNKTTAELRLVSKYAAKHYMRVNHKKTKVLL